MGYHLRRIKVIAAKDKVHVGGRGKGQLTRPPNNYRTITVLQFILIIPYDTVWSAYYHAISTDEEPQHDFCGNWCFYNQHMVDGNDM